MQRIVLLTLLILAANVAMSQSTGSTYKTALGVKVYPGAISVKHFTKSNVALEGLGYISNDGFRLTGLYEYHGDFNGVEGLKWYIGGGGHIGVWSDNWRNRYPTRNDGLAIGVDGVLGVDYKV
ncbi:MAG: hypothetical protein RLZZ429_2111, partial [Bacteroidota bacterium]